MISEKSKELYRVLQSKGFPDDFCYELAYRQLTTDYTATRMIGYLYRMTDVKIELVVDEMLAILEDRNRLVKKHEAERAQQAINRLYAEGLEDDE